MADVLDKLGCDVALGAMVELDEASARQLQVCNTALRYINSPVLREGWQVRRQVVVDRMKVVREQAQRIIDTPEDERTIGLAVNAMGIVDTVVKQGDTTLAELDAREGR